MRANGWPSRRRGRHERSCSIRHTRSARPCADARMGRPGGVFGPLSFLYRTMELSARAVMPGGVVIIFGDWRRMPDLGDAACMTGLRPAAMVAWVRTRPRHRGALPGQLGPHPDRRQGHTEDGQPGSDQERRHYGGGHRPAGSHRSGSGPSRSSAARTSRPWSRPTTSGPAGTRTRSRPRSMSTSWRGSASPGTCSWIRFSGSGSSRTACENLGMGLRWRGADIDPAYAELP